MHPWRERLLTLFGPGLCSGMTSGDWLSLLLENRFAIDPPYWPRAVTISACSVANSVVAAFESAFYALKIRNALDTVYRDRDKLTKDVGGKAGTSEFADSIIAAIK